MPDELAPLPMCTEGFDQEDIKIASDPEFWAMIRQRREQATITREELERRLAG